MRGGPNPIRAVGGSACITLIVVVSCLELRTVEGSSMAPALHEGQRVVVLRVAYGFSFPVVGGGPILTWNRVKRNDIVVFHHPDTDEELVKRCIGVSGDRVVVRGNGISLLPTGGRVAEGEYTIPPGFIYVEGDDTATSIDSRHYGLIPTRSIRGRVVLPIRRRHMEPF